MKILINDGLSQNGIDLLSQNGFEVINEHIPQDKLIEYLNNNQIDAIVVRSNTQVRQELIEQVPMLKLIARAGKGIDNIDVDFAKNYGLQVINAADASARGVAEMVFSHLFSLARSLYDANRAMPLEGDQNFLGLKMAYQNGVELKGKTLGIIGLGAIGQEVAKIGLALGMNVVGADSSDTDGKKSILWKFPGGKEVAVSIAVKTKEELLKTADFVTLHVPAQENYIIGEKELALMKPSTFLINTARGGVVDEVALIDALNHEEIAGAALDVFENEPTPEIQILMHPKISLSPHIAGSTVETQERIGENITQQVIDLLKEDLY